jgi:hypothetical protein
MQHDFIAHARRIEDALNIAGSKTIAERFEDARLGGATSGEILMGLRHECRLAQPDPAIPEEVKADMLALIRAVDKTGI